MDPVWTRIGTRAELEEKRVLVVRPGGRQLAVFDTPRGVLACNNRCPHEGYPLSEGSLDGRCVLTCNWHNWKFSLESGENLYGGDRLRTYPVEIRGADIWVDIAEPPFEERHAQVLASLRDAFDDNDYERMARELGRLQLIGGDVLDAARAAVEWSHDRMEFGWTHAFAALATWLEVAARDPSDDEVRLACLLEAIGHIADDVLREPRFPYPEGVEAYDEEGFVAAIEQEDPRVFALARGALADGGGFARLERGLARAALAHYNAFGHSAIYVVRARRLIGQLGESVTEPVVLSLVREILFARREDLIPEFRGYAGAHERFGSVGNSVHPTPSGWRGLGIKKALEETVRVSGAPTAEVFDALLGANALNLLAYDITQQEKIRIPVDDNINWLDFTHAITFAAATHELCDRFPELWPAALLQLGCFCGRNMRYTVDAPALADWSVADPQVFFDAEIERVLDHREDEFIVSVHRVKTLMAARDLITGAALSDETRAAVLAGVNRYLHSPARLKQVRRTVYQAMQFVARDG